MATLAWIVVGGLAMSAIAMVGGLTVLLRPATLERLLLPLVALAAGTLLGGAFFHMVPEGSRALSPLAASVWLLAGFTAFLLLEQFLNWHHGHGERRPAPMTYLVLAGDTLHNLLGGLAIASTFMLDPRAGLVAWLAAAAHEVPQELGDFAVLVHGGWTRRRALLWNLASALSFPLGGLVAFAASWHLELSGLVLLGAGNFLYIAASDLIPEIKATSRLPWSLAHFACFAAGLGGMLGLALAVAA
ncbi:ZIP family metal transporter [Halomonas nitroreducens]|uniref:ZIP family metal transporter n=1 Tax=Halomonas nitroreducens TaxID=447425 RepID=A0A3S0JV15_9GAMM|nr:ZIP family metal transporter [Halomonas nitroreducens]